MKNELSEAQNRLSRVSSISDFCKISGETSYFTRFVGASGLPSIEIENMDFALLNAVRSGKKLYYKRISALPMLTKAEDTKFYLDCAKNFDNRLELRYINSANGLGQKISEAVKNVKTVFEKVRRDCTPSIMENFLVKQLFWADCIFSDFKNVYDSGTAVKICAANITKTQEYLFFCMLATAGFDVLLFQNEADIDSVLDSLKLSEKIVLGSFNQKGTLTSEGYSVCSGALTQQTVNNNGSENIKMKIPPRIRRKPDIQTADVGNNVSPEKNEKNMEQLAALAASIVLITIHDRNGKIIGTGSGIMISEKGYILTNNHVVHGGAYFSVQIENDSNVYETNELIKYNIDCDLAIIRIDRRLKPIKIYSGSAPLVRGQAVVAIGSPLGLFNSVSDGIISGFREFEHVKMIQFTAPISPGSSGGAVLNMYGEVIGISTAVFDCGQNINLAVRYEYINTFIKGFL